MSEGTELTVAHEGKALAAPQSESAQRFAMTLQLIREAMFDPGVDAQKAKVMADLMNGQEDRLLLTEFNSSLNSAIMDMPVITKAGIITIPAKGDAPERTQGRFARFEDIDRVVRPILERHNLSIRFDIDDSQNGKVLVRPIIGHRNGQTWTGSAMGAPLDTSGAKNNVQGAGSTVSYLKRYTMCAALNIITEGTDDDGSLGKFAIGMTHEREVTVLEQAEEAAAAGTYAAFFNAQSPKDRGWLISSNNHSRLGGAPALPDSSRSSPPPGRGAPQGGGRNLDTAEGWTEQYIEDCGKADSLDDLREIQTKGANALKKLERGKPDLHAKAIRAGTDAFDRLGGAL
jgi:hypothetical protein